MNFELMKTVGKAVFKITLLGWNHVYKKVIEFSRIQGLSIYIVTHTLIHVSV